MPKNSYENTGKENDFSADQILLPITDLKGRITYANDVFCQITDYSPNKLLGHGHV